MILPLMIIPSICAAAKRNKKDKDFDNCTLDASLYNVIEWMNRQYLFEEKK